MLFYPLLFEPIFKERIWGGTKLKELLNKSFDGRQIGESWELSTVENDISVVANGAFEGLNLNQLIKKYPTEVLGAASIKNFGLNFPLLFKFIDAKEDLSIQVHPNDELAKKRHNSYGKTEMWYVLQADEIAEIIVGFKEDSTPEDYLKHLKNNSLNAILKTEKVQKGDVFFLETGVVHAIGAGNLIAEIQQTSDITYRIYDFDRKDASGNTRELHTELALEAINYKKSDTKKRYSTQINQVNEVVNCPYFTTNFIPLNGAISVLKKGNSFTVYMCTEGAFEIQYNNETLRYKKGDTILIPALLNQYQIKGNASILEIYIS